MQSCHVSFCVVVASDADCCEESAAADDTVTNVDHSVINDRDNIAAAGNKVCNGLMLLSVCLLCLP